MMAKCIVLTAIAMLAVACVASPLSRDTAVNTKATGRFPARLEARVSRSVHVPGDQRELVSRQLLQALSEIIQREDCVTDYQGWVDFGRRSTEI
ncbi:gastrin/cholecystokinin-like peptide [Carassius gibelio]|uniref:gastrin/cholecystokinin-like peptide n=1 Tax=Carassius gibelio TaxID=101364 RepID=UPI002279B482|nr:gastrin/cholecystokinin-like peptide [Carassius gibelio]